MKKIEIYISGNPPRTTHQSGTKIAGHRTYKTKALKDTERYLEGGLRPYVPAHPLEGPVALQVEWRYLARSKRQDGAYKTTRPDTDNLQKTLKDTMTKMGFWNDDAQVVVEMVSKSWSSDPCIKIWAKELETGKMVQGITKDGKKVEGEEIWEGITCFIKTDKGMTMVEPYTITELCIENHSQKVEKYDYATD